MHVYFLGIGGAGICPLAQIAKQAGYDVSGSDKYKSSYVDYLIAKGITNISVGDTPELITQAHQQQAIDWLIYGSAVAMDASGRQQLAQAKSLGIKSTKRDEFTSEFVKQHNLKMIAVAGTHGKTTTTAMIAWLFVSLGQPISHLIPAKVSFSDMGVFNPASQYFVYEADEYDRNFLAFNPYLCVISGVSWDHHEIYPTREDYIKAFNDFINQSQQTVIWASDAKYLGTSSNLLIQDDGNERLNQLSLKGLYNRRDAWLAITSVGRLLGLSEHELVAHINKFPGLARRMEEIYPGLFTDYAHTPDKIKAAMSMASEMATERGQPLIVIYEPLTNRRQIHMLNDYKDCFKGASHVYWLPSYLAREDPADRIITPEELIAKLDDPSIAEPAGRNDQLINIIHKHLEQGHMVVAMAGGGGDSLDDWLREKFTIGS